MNAQSFYPVLEDSTATHRKDLFLAYSNLQRAFVNEEYKYIIYHVNGKTTEQLFNLRKDPLEMHDLFSEN